MNEIREKTSKLAIASLVLGILGLFVALAPLIAIIIAETFRYNNKKRDVPLGGSRIAWWGFGLGVFSILMNFIVIGIEQASSFLTANQ